MTAIGEQSLRWFAADRVKAEPDVASLVSEHSGLLYRVAFSVLRNAAEAEDVVQDTFLRVVQQKTLLDVLEMRPWLVRIAMNLSLDRRRSTRPDQMDALFAESLVAREVSADAALVEVQSMLRVLQEMERLPKAERQVLLLSAVEELTTVEMGKVLSKSESAVRALLFRARTRLRERLEKGGSAR
ncbi:MAG: polymerase, sigma-24 subunit, subfamily [Acidobacteriaceae bacterium]|nr:polymerase, sigma-24 subunit, subfamily [Acidobacteriaceae bacterium]